MEYRSFCQKLVESDPTISFAFIINSDARLLASSGVEDSIEISEERFAELMEDLLFTLSSRKHYEDLFGTLQFIQIKHSRVDTFLFPFEEDKTLCICLEASSYNLTKFLDNLQIMLPRVYKLVRSKV